MYGFAVHLSKTRGRMPGAETATLKKYMSDELMQMKKNEMNEMKNDTIMLFLALCRCVDVFNKGSCWWTAAHT